MTNVALHLLDSLVLEVEAKVSDHSAAACRCIQITMCQSYSVAAAGLQLKEFSQLANKSFLDEGLPEWSQFFAHAHTVHITPT